MQILMNMNLPTTSEFNSNVALMNVYRKITKPKNLYIRPLWEKFLTVHYLKCADHLIEDKLRLKDTWNLVMNIFSEVLIKK